mmetsp:Transcript_6338/g.15702  ORF Transcript_6338/g.15702 Transcript_6338/m.15702 type:complete len:339 (-) Transcript_6338:127-1143(-)
MRVFSVSIVAALILLIQGCSGKGSLNAPSVFAVRNTKHPASTAVFGMPRGGAVRDVPPTAGLMVGGAIDGPPTSTTISDFISGLFSPKKIGWTISFVINLAYLYYFFQVRASQEPGCDYSSGGFCVTNFKPQTETCPPLNSHTFAFIVDCIFTAVGFLVPSALQGGEKYALIGIIFGHGCLHALLGLVVSCTNKPFWGAVALFAAFSVAISYIIVDSIGSLSRVANIVLGLAAGFLCVFLSGSNGENGISSIFLITQLLSTAGGSLFPKGDGLSPKLGLSFIAPCLVSLIELVYCCDPSTGGASLFNKLGGHMWYDVFLHTSILIALIYGPTGKPDEA